MDQPGKVSQKERQIADQLFHSKYEDLGERERKVARHLAERTHIARSTSQEFADQMTFGQRIADDRVAAFGGSWVFISMFGAVLLLLDSGQLGPLLLKSKASAFDPLSAYLLLNLVFCHASLLSRLSGNPDVPKPTSP